MKRSWRSKENKQQPEVAPPLVEEVAKQTQTATREAGIDPDDPLLTHFLNAQGLVDLEKLNFNSQALQTLREEGVRITLPLVSQGELIGLLNLGPRLSEQDYSTDDRRLLNTLATQAAPALRVAQLAKQQQAEARQLERMEQELRVARVIQQTLLPKAVPEYAGWSIYPYWQPARAVSGDFYDFIIFPDGKVGVVEADVTDKGVPAALVMATTRTILRAAAERFVSPGQVLEQANNLLFPDMPRNMFVTCLYMVLDTVSGEITFANAGHNLPIKHTAAGMVELRATGMPLGLLPDMQYEEYSAIIEPGERLLIYSDGLVEAHNPEREMFGFPRLKESMAEDISGENLAKVLVQQLADFTGADWEQEDDVTLVVLNRQAFADSAASPDQKMNAEWKTLAEFNVPSEPGNERHVLELVAGAVGSLNFSQTRLDRLKTAVGEATMNAMEHGNRYNAALPVMVGVYTTASDLLIRITDFGSGRQNPQATAPDLEAKLAGLQSPRGWGLFLIESMVDVLTVTADDQHHTIELTFHLEGVEL